MKSSRPYVAALAVAGLLSSAALVRAADSAKPNAESNQQNKQMDQQQQTNHKSAKPNMQAPEGWVLVEEDSVLLTADEPQNHFLRAEQFLDQKQPREAAGELRIAAAYLDMQASRGNGKDDDSQLSKQADHLRHAARQILNAKSEDQKKDSKEFARDFQQADLALSQHLQMLAKSEVGGQKQMMAGHDLQSATDSLSAAYAWSTQQPTKQIAADIQDAQRVSSELMMMPMESNATETNSSSKAETAGSKIAPDNTAQAPKDAAACITKFGQAIQDSQTCLDKTKQASPASGT
jgi:hypothetical protein